DIQQAPQPNAQQRIRSEPHTPQDGHFRSHTQAQQQSAQHLEPYQQRAGPTKEPARPKVHPKHQA
ncbi:hypothetical protein ACLUWU_03050, partial [Bifidobacterium thermophilum]|uniref:hypothetical protein n=1 Tax=Bifidobacterium thermophilum TaxID=33905 RepID=UPI003992875D